MSALGLNFTINMTLEGLILLSLSKKRPKNKFPDTRGAGYLWLSQWKCVFLEHPVDVPEKHKQTWSQFLPIPLMCLECFLPQKTATHPCSSRPINLISHRQTHSNVCTCSKPKQEEISQWSIFAKKTAQVHILSPPAYSVLSSFVDIVLTYFQFRRGVHFLNKIGAIFSLWTA